MLGMVKYWKCFSCSAHARQSHRYNIKWTQDRHKSYCEKNSKSQGLCESMWRYEKLIHRLIYRWINWIQKSDISFSPVFFPGFAEIIKATSIHRNLIKLVCWKSCSFASKKREEERKKNDESKCNWRLLLMLDKKNKPDSPCDNHFKKSNIIFYSPFRSGMKKKKKLATKNCSSAHSDSAF